MFVGVLLWYALELHMVHTSSQPNTTNNTAVVGLFYKTGDRDSFLDEVCRWRSLESTFIL